MLVGQSQIKTAEYYNFSKGGYFNVPNRCNSNRPLVQNRMLYILPYYIYTIQECLTVTASLCSQLDIYVTLCTNIYIVFNISPDATRLAEGTSLTYTKPPHWDISTTKLDHIII